ncbi:alpha-latrotoxin-Lhe1a-like [Condylostylus longicornis]|uniref:alpha-latrotoxin-Lhe1a-like n=1 Tax=Condylostylus longicornis TaxID=2530218 RepID=UPI00244E1868|nr:alpha-latrotoxin-Lhe1a-like [Condylostylus longicornis]
MFVFTSGLESHEPLASLFKSQGCGPHTMHVSRQTKKIARNKFKGAIGMPIWCLGRKRIAPTRLSQLGPSIVLDIKKGKTKEVLAALLDDNINVKDDCGDTALHLSIAFHKFKISDELLKARGLDVNAVNLKSQTPFMVAILHKNTDALNKLLKRHAQELNPRICDGDGNNFLHYAAKKSLNSKIILATMKSLEALHGDLSPLAIQQNSSGNTPFHVAIEHGSLGIADLLLSMNKDLLDSQNKDGETPLGVAFRVGNDQLTAMLLSLSSTYPPDLLLRIVESNMHVLLEQLYKATDPKGNSSSVLGYSFQRSSLEKIRQLISVYNENELIHNCIKKGRIELIRIFLSLKNIDLTLLDKEEFDTPLMLSLKSEFYRADIVRQLLDWLVFKKQMCDSVGQVKSRNSTDDLPIWSVYVTGILNRPNSKRLTPLMQLFHCSAMGDEMVAPCIQQLLNLGADPTLFDEKGNTALAMAVCQGNVRAVELLRIAGASATVVNQDGISAADIALEQQDEELVDAVTADIDVLLKRQKR